MNCERSCETCAHLVGPVLFGETPPAVEFGIKCRKGNKRATLKGFPHKRTTCPDWTLNAKAKGQQP